MLVGRERNIALKEDRKEELRMRERNSNREEGNIRGETFQYEGI